MEEKKKKKKTKMAVVEDLGAGRLLAKEVQESPRGKPREELTSGWWDTAPP